MKKIVLFIALLFSVGFAYSQVDENLSPEEKERRQKNIDIGNPFARFGYKPKIATLSKGKYLEFHDRDTIVKIGSFSYHTRNKIISGYYSLDSLRSEATLHPTLISRWFSPDPLSDEFPSWSPYNFVYNNPIMFIDPDGRAPQDWFVNKNTGALVYIKGESELNQETATNAFGEMSNLIFDNEKNDFSNWENIGGDTMFDTADNKVSENKSDFKSESVAESFAENQGFSIAIKTDVTQEINSQYWNDGGNSMNSLHNNPVEKKIHNQGYTYVKQNSKTLNKQVGRIERNIGGTGWDIVRYRVIKTEVGKERDFSGGNHIYKKKGSIDIQNENKNN